MIPELPAAPAAERNKQAICDALVELLDGAPGEVLLEVASGTGQHAAHCAPRLAPKKWQPTEPSAEALAIINAWGQTATPCPLEARQLDVAGPDWAAPWRDTDVLAIFAANLVHISPWPVTEGLFKGAGSLLASDRPLILYGPFRRGGDFGAQSNRDFDQWLKAKDPAFGIRDLDDLESLAAGVGLALAQLKAMPANNHLAVFRRVT